MKTARERLRSEPDKYQQGQKCNRIRFHIAEPELYGPANENEETTQQPIQGVAPKTPDEACEDNDRSESAHHAEELKSNVGIFYGEGCMQEAVCFPCKVRRERRVGKLLVQRLQTLHRNQVPCCEVTISQQEDRFTRRPEQGGRSTQPEDEQADSRCTGSCLYRLDDSLEEADDSPLNRRNKRGGHAEQCGNARPHGQERKEMTAPIHGRGKKRRMQSEQNEDNAGSREDDFGVIGSGFRHSGEDACKGESGSPRGAHGLHTAR